MNTISPKSSLSPIRLSRGKVPEVYVKKDLCKGKFWAESEKEKEREVLDPRIALSDHTKAIPKSCFYHIRALKHIRDSLDSSMIRTIAAALSPLGWIMQILSYTASLQNISLASSVFKILSHVLLEVVVLLIVLLIWLL